MKKSVFCLLTSASLTLGLVACGSSPEAPETIRIGEAISLSGANAQGVSITTGPVYDMWVEEVNDKGGLFIQEYNKRIPIEYIKYDDESDIDKMKELLEKLMLEDKVDFLLPPWSTAFLYDAATLANRYGYIMMGGAGGAIKLKEISSGLPYFFEVLNFADTQMPALADILEEVGVKRVAILFVNDLHGVEYSGTLVPELATRGIDVVLIRSYDLTESDIPGVLAETMTDANDLDADAFIGLTYPEATFPAPGVAMELGYSPKVMHFNVGSSFEDFVFAYGAEAVEGIMGPGAWNAKTSKGAAEFEAAFKERWEDVGVDYWGGLMYYAGCQFFEQAIEKAGTLDQSKVREVMATETFDTAMGPMKFENGLNVSHPGEMGQWQDGVFEVIGPEDKRTADPEFPKPAWPAP